MIYIVKENRTYDQVFGSLGKGNGDPSLNLFGDQSAPNQRALARDFVTLDNFYTDGAVSSDGWDWATGSASNSYNERFWTVAYGGRGRGDDVYTNPATDPGKITGDSRIWDKLDNVGTSFRNYGMWAGGPLPAKVFSTERRLATPRSWLPLSASAVCWDAAIAAVKPTPVSVTRLRWEYSPKEVQPYLAREAAVQAEGCADGVGADVTWDVQPALGISDDLAQ